jgi:hypothetical protein
MTVEENRLAHLRVIVDAEAKAVGGRRRAGYRAVATATGLGEEYIYQLYRGIKTVIGPDAARSISRVYGQGRTDGWFELPPETPSDTSEIEDEAMRAMPTIGATIRHLGAILGTLNAMGRASVAPLIQQVLENPELAEEAAMMADAIAAAQRMDLKDQNVNRAFDKARLAPVETDIAPLDDKPHGPLTR